MGRMGAAARRFVVVIAGCFFALSLFAAPGTARAQLYDANDDPIFDQGTWTLNLSGGYFQDFTFDSDEQVGIASAGAGYFLFDDFSVNLTGDAYYLDTQEKSPFGALGFTLLFRWHALEFGDRCTVYIDGGSGALWAEETIPDFGTHFNFTPQAGLGLTYRIRDNVHFFGGARWFHISNANRRGGDENPGSDAVGGYVGVMFVR